MDKIPNEGEFNRLGEAYEESTRMLVLLIRKTEASKVILRKTTEDLEQKPDSEDIQIEVLRLQEDISRMAAEYDQELIEWQDHQSRFLEERKEFFRRSYIFPIDMKALQRPGSCNV